MPVSWIAFPMVMFCQMAHQGAKVIHARAVEIAMEKEIPIVVKSTFSDAPGTLICNENVVRKILLSQVVLSAVLLILKIWHSLKSDLMAMM